MTTEEGRRSLRRPFSLREVSVTVLLAALVAGIYLQTLSFGFVFDDHLYVLRNPVVQDGLTWDGVRRAFFELRLGFWHPLTLVSHMADVSLFGLSPAGHHATAVGLHAANTVLCFLVLRAATGVVWPAALVAALFGIHPLRAESVAYVAERKDVLSVLFWFLTIGAWLHHLRRPSAGRYLTALGAFVAGLTAKPMLVTLPFVLLLLDFWPFDRVRKPTARLLGRLVAEKAPFLVLSFGASALAYVAQERYGVLSPVHPFALPIRLFNAVYAYGRYLAKTVWPVDLAAFYPHPGSSIPVGSLAVAGVAVAGLSCVALFTLRRLPFIAVGWFWFFGTLVPVIGLVQLGDMGMADRFTYAPSVGLAIMVAWGAAAWAGRRTSRRVGVGVIAVAVVLGLSLLCFRQVGFWRDNITLFSRTLAIIPFNPLIRFNLAVSYGQAGRLEEAEREYRRLLREDPGHLPAYGDLSDLLASTSREEESLEVLRAGLKRAPQSPRLNYLMGVRLQGRQPEEAVVHLETAVRLKPAFPEAHNELGIIRARQGDYDAAERHFREALQDDPRFANARENLLLLQKLRGSARQGP